MSKESVNIHVNNYCRLRDKQYAVYTEYARKHGLTTKELFILDIIYFAQDGCTQAGICERLSATKQTVSAAIKKFWKLGYLSFEESKTDRRIRLIRFTAAGKEYVERIIPPAAQDVRFAVKPHKLYLFNKKTQERIEMEGERSL